METEVNETTLSRKAQQPSRIGISIPAHIHERLQEVCARHRVTQSGLLEALVSVMSDAEIEELRERVIALRKLEGVLERNLAIQALNMVRGKSSQQIDQIARAAENALDEK